MHSDKHRLLEKLFKLVWIVGLAFSIYIFFGLMIMSFLTQSILEDTSEILTWLNFVIPNLLALLLLVMYTKELIWTYKPKNEIRNIISFATVTFTSCIILFTQLEFYTWIIDDFKEDIFIVIPITLILTSMIGLIYHRVNRFKRTSNYIKR